MLTNAQIKTILIDNLNDLRINGAALFINNLISRENYGGGIEQYRIYNTNTNSYVESLVDFINGIDENTLVQNWNINTGLKELDKTQPTVITLSNFEVSLEKTTDEDYSFTEMYGVSTKKIVIVLNYLSDGDTILPLKIVRVKLVQQ